MSIETTVKSALDSANTAAGTRNYTEGWESPQAPYTVYSLPANVPDNGFDGPIIDNARVQVDSYATTRIASRALAVQVRTALEAAGGICLLEQGVYEAEMKLHRTIQDYSFWA